MEHTILFGNGLNRMNPDNKSWCELLESISSDTSILKNVPNTINYEHINDEINSSSCIYNNEHKLKKVK